MAHGSLGYRSSRSSKRGMQWGGFGHGYRYGQREDMLHYQRIVTKIKRPAEPMFATVAELMRHVRRHGT